MSSLNGQAYSGGSNGRMARFGTPDFWNKALLAILVPVIIGGGAMLLRHETAIAVNGETVTNIKSQIADVKNDTSDIKRQLRDIGRDVRRNSKE